MAESTVKHLKGWFPYSQFLTMRAAFFYKINNDPAFAGIDPELRPILGGICFRAISTGDAVLGGFSNGFEAILVGWQPVTGGPSTIYFFKSSIALAPPASESATAGYTLPLNPNAIISTENLDGFTLFRNYDGTSEIEYAFIDIVTFEYLAKPTNMGFYNTNSSGQFLNPNTSSPFTDPNTQRGLSLSRAFMSFREGTEYVKYRNLRMAPYPEPALPDGDPSRPSIAYYMGAACPPRWRSVGSAVVIPPPTGAVAPEMASERAIVLPTGEEQTGGEGKDKKNCVCVANEINMVEFHDEAIKQGVISKEPPVPYRFPRWPWVLAAILVFIGVVATSYYIGREFTHK